MAYSKTLTIPPRPFLKWAGGKGRLLDQYDAFIPERFDTYYEPFLGGGAVFFYLLPNRSKLMDINPELVNVYRCVRNQVERLIKVLFEHQQNHSKEYYYFVRANPGSSEIERAARLIYLNRTCFNGLYRENSRGHFNVPMGSYKDPRICNPELLRAASATLKWATINVQSFESVLDDAHGPRDFVYFDPPYHPISATSCFTSYCRFSFTEADQIRLRDTFAELASRKVKVMLSNSDCSLIRELYRDFNIHTIYASRAINSNAQRRGKITELLITSY
ncbi:MAG TPA: DNA adenine methylase [Chroococcidiopsis sp.]